VPGGAARESINSPNPSLLTRGVALVHQSDIKEQGKKLMTMIGVAVNGLSKLDTIVGAVQEMGKRHAGYGVKDEHYDTVAAALLWTLEKGLQDAFTEEVKGAWIETYTLLSTTMKDAAKEVSSSAEEEVPWHKRTI
jgi:hemoglobin-like flavoprotein